MMPYQNELTARSPYTWFCSTLLFPLHERMKRHESTQRRRGLEESQWWSSDRIEAHRIARLQRFLTTTGVDLKQLRADTMPVLRVDRKSTRLNSSH